MNRDKEKGTVLTFVPAASNVGERLIADEMRDRVASNSKTFLRMEESVRHASLMARIVQDLIVQAEEDDGVEMKEHLVWGVLHLVDMVKPLRGFYLNQDAEEDADGGAS